MVLSDLNTEVHKSVNQFLIDAADCYISKLEGQELTNGEKQKPGECLYITKEDLDQIRREIKDELQKEMIIILGSALAGGQIRQVPEINMEKKAAPDVEADETMLGLAESWG